MRHRKTRNDPPGLALLDRIESHLNDWRRRAFWQDRRADVDVFDAALDTISHLQRSARGQSRKRDTLLALRNADRLLKRLAA